MRFIGCRMTPFKGRFSRSANRESLVRSARKSCATLRDPAGPTSYAVFNAPDGAPYVRVEKATSPARTPTPGGRTEKTISPWRTRTHGNPPVVGPR